MNPTTTHRLARALGPALGLAAAYVAAGLLALQLAIPPSYAAPLYPPAGIALAAVLVYGWRALPGVALGAFIINLTLSSPRGRPDLAAWAVPIAISLGAAAQAGLGVLLVRRFVARPLTLGEPRDIVRFFVLGGPVACLLNATLATAVLSAAGVIGPAERNFSAWTWWIGDTLGVLIAAPIVLTLVGRPREEWRPRRSTVGLPMLVVTGLLVLATLLVARWDTQRAQATFERSASATADAMAERLRDPLQALEATRGLFLGSGDVTQDELERASQAWFDSASGLQAVGYSERLARSELAAFESRKRSLGMSDYRVFDRGDVDAATLARDPDVVAIREIVPLAANRGALGVNALSVPAAREAIERSVRDNRPAATAGFRLTQDERDRTGIVIYRALYRGHAAPPVARRRSELAGVVFVTLRVDDLAQSMMAGAPDYLRWCLVDTAPEVSRRRLAGPVGCEDSVAAALTYRRSYDVAGRRWELRLDALPSALPEAQHWNAWLFSGVGLLAVAMLGALLLIVTGRARRIEQVVDARTADLRREVAERQRAQDALQQEMGVREHTQAALRESQRQLRSIVDHVPIGVRYTDLSGRLIEVNPAYCQLTGYRADELLGMEVGQLHHPDDRAAGSAWFKSVVRGEAGSTLRELRYRTKTGLTRWVRVSLRLVGTPGDPLARTVGVVEDITEHLMLRDAERARQAAEAANRAKSEFLSRMSHELRTPLNAMLGFAQLLELDQKPSLPPHQAEWASQIQHAGWHLLHMINETLDLSRIESGTLKLDIGPVDVGGLIRAATAMIEPSAGQRGIRITRALDPAARSLLGDSTRLKQIVTNLLSNAVKYNQDGGSILVESRLSAHDTVEIVVADNGLGMTESQLAHLFEPFNRLGREKSTTEGTGIGLVISRRLAELMGGSLQADSRPGHGSTFALRMPSAESAAASEPDAGPVTGPAEYHQRVVHYIEDNETNVEVMRGILAQRPQVRLEVSASGLDGLAAVRTSPPSLILLDMNLPDIGGLELLRHLRADPATQSIPVVVVSADATTAAFEQAFAAGTSDYVTKPINVPGFLVVLDRALESQDTLFG